MSHARTRIPKVSIPASLAKAAPAIYDAMEQIKKARAATRDKDNANLGNKGKGKRRQS